MPPVKIVRDIPLWALLSALGTGVGAAINLYYSNQALVASAQRQSVELSSLAATMRSVEQELNKGNVRAAEVQFKLEDLSRRVAQNELQIQALRRAP